MDRKVLTPRSILMLFSEPRVIEVARSLGLDALGQTFGGAIAAIERHVIPAGRILEGLADHELHFLCLRQSVVPDPSCPREQLIGFLLGLSHLDCGAHNLAPAPPPQSKLPHPPRPPP